MSTPRTEPAKTGSITRKRASAAPNTERVRLERVHTHEGKKHAAGTLITVHVDTANWLRCQGVVSPTTTSETTTED